MIKLTVGDCVWDEMLSLASRILRQRASHDDDVRRLAELVVALDRRRRTGARGNIQPRVPPVP